MRLIQTLKPYAPRWAKTAVRQGWAAYRHSTSSVRVLPNFLIIGAQRCGTTSLYSYLVQHPWVSPAWAKELDFFSKNFAKGLAWYRSQFPTSLERVYAQYLRQRRLLTGEASPSYMIYPHAPRRAWQIIPGAKLIALLRNPVDRAYSHFQAMVKAGVERLSFEEAIEAEPERLRTELERIRRDEQYYSLTCDNYCYLSRGLYRDQLDAWMVFFPKEQLLILQSEELFADPPGVLARVFEFLGAPRYDRPSYEKYDPYGLGGYAEMNPATRKRILEYFAPHNRRLDELLGCGPSWDR